MTMFSPMLRQRGATLEVGASSLLDWADHHTKLLVVSACVAFWATIGTSIYLSL